MSFDWLVFDEGYGAAVPFFRILSLVGQRFVAEVPVNVVVRKRLAGVARRADARLTAADANAGRRYRLMHQTVLLDEPKKNLKTRIAFPIREIRLCPAVLWVIRP